MKPYAMTTFITEILQLAATFYVQPSAQTIVQFNRWQKVLQKNLKSPIFSDYST